MDIEVGEIPKYGSYIRCRCSIAICEDVKAMFKIADDLEFVLKCLEKSLKEYLYKCHRYHCFCRFRQE
ncbi:hypothetical protein SAMN02910274_01980, partial [Bacteroides sp. AR29]|uniref:hypothetical protein n=1 Tax=Bacteroides sp. AR29 TaxID=93975 RepID=UPI000BD802C2